MANQTAAVLKLNQYADAQAFMTKFLESEVSRFFQAGVTVPRKPGPVEYNIQLVSTGDAPDLTEAFVGLLKASFKDGMLANWGRAVQFV